jgi:hypothetical protein
MAEGIVQISEGSGKKLHTFERTVGANSVHDSVMVPGEPYRATYQVLASQVSTATAGGRLLSVWAGASSPVRIWYVSIYQTALATAANRMRIVMQRHAVAGTDGTLLTNYRHDRSDPAPGFTARTLPTTAVSSDVFLPASITMYQAHPIGAGASWEWSADKGGRLKPIVIPAGTTNGVAFINSVAVAGGSVEVTMILDEGTY